MIAEHGRLGNRRGRRVAALALATACLTPLALISAQVTAPVWAKPDHFWFRKAMAGGHVYLAVDALHGVREPLFDHQRLAIELTLRTGSEYTPLTLPFADPAAQFVVNVPAGDPRSPPPVRRAPC